MATILGTYKDGMYTSLEGIKYPLYVSEYDKTKNQYEVTRKILDHYDAVSYEDLDRIAKIQENKEIYGGRWPSISSMRLSTSVKLGNEDIVIGGGQLNHYPLIDRVAKGIVSDIISRPLIPVIRDISSRSRNFRERLKLDKVRDFFQRTVIDPYMERISFEYDMQNGIEDFTQLEIEEQQQRYADLQRRFAEENPEDILDYIDSSRSPDELIADALLKEGMRRSNAIAQFAIGAENAVVNAEEYYRMDIINGNPTIEALNLKGVSWAGSKMVTEAQDGQFARYVQYLTPEDAITKYAMELSREDIKDISKLYSTLPQDNKAVSVPHSRDQVINERITQHFRNNPELNAETDLRTREGQEVLKGLYQKYSGHGDLGYGVKESFITFRWTKRVSIVKRVINGSIETFIRDDHYKKNVQAGDLEVNKTVIPQVWKGVKLGNEDHCIYIDVGPRPGQYSSLTDPFDVKLNIYGGKYGTSQNDTRATSLVDLGKPWQYKYNVKMKLIERIEATDLGRVFLGTATMKPKEWTWAQWYTSLFNTNIAVIATHNRGVNNIDSRMFQSIDMSRNNEVAAHINNLEYLENKIITSMYYSPQNLGAISQYATNRNIQATEQGVSRQLYTFFDRNRRIKESVLTGFLQTCLYAYKDNEEIKSIVLDDFLRAHFDENFNNGIGSNYNLYVVDDFLESDKLRELRSLSLSLIQNSLSASDLVTLWNVESVAELQTEFEKIDKKAREQVEAGREHESQMLERQQQIQAQVQESRQLFLEQNNEREREARIRMAYLNSLMMQNANDVNRDGINDSLEKAIEQIKSKEKIEFARMQNEKSLGERKLDIKEKELEIKEKEIESRKGR